MGDMGEGKLLLKWALYNNILIKLNSKWIEEEQYSYDAVSAQVYNTNAPIGSTLIVYSFHSEVANQRI